jgi:hypothetical protein
MAGRILNIISTLDHIASDRSTKIYNIPEKIITLQKKSLAIYATYGDKAFDEWENNLFDQLNSLGFQILIVHNISNYTNQGKILRTNVGYDLAAIRDVIRLLNKMPEQLLLINSSIAYSQNFYKLINHARQIATSKNNPVVSCTESFQTRHHAQSYFFYAKGDAVFDLMRVYEKMKNWKTKRAAVYFGELRVMKQLSTLGREVKFIYPYEFILKKAIIRGLFQKSLKDKMPWNRNLNPTQHFWETLTSEGAPFVKRNLILMNPTNLKKRPNSIAELFSSEINYKSR